MAKRILRVNSKVFNIEVFYDLMFSYLISRICNVIDVPGKEIFGLQHYATYAVVLLSVLKVWFDTTLLLNRYGNNSGADNVCMFTNMFFLYLMAEGFDGDNITNFKIFALSLFLITANLIVHWRSKLHLYANMDEEDHSFINHTVKILTVQLVLMAISYILPIQYGRWGILLALPIGITSWLFHDSYKVRTTNFQHLTERCWLLVIVVFGSSVQDVALFMDSSTHQGLLASVSVFLLIIGLFLVYGYQYEYLLDRQRDVENGTRYLVLNAAIVFILSNLTVAIDYLSRPEVHLVQKTTFFTLMLVAYLFVTYLFNDFFKSGFETKRRNAVFRLVACLCILAFSLTAAIDTRITISLDTVVVYLVALHEMHFRWNNTTEEELPPVVSFFITGSNSEDD